MVQNMVCFGDYSWQEKHVYVPVLVQFAGVNYICLITAPEFNFVFANFLPVGSAILDRGYWTLHL